MMEWLEIVLSKLWDKLIDYGSHTTRSIVDFKSTLESLGRNFRALSARASDVEEDVKNRERSGKKKRKREVENWLKEVQIIVSEFLALEKEVEERAFISRFFGGDRATNLNARVDGLVEQSRHFGDLVLDVDVAKGEPLLAPKLTGEEFEKDLERIWKFSVTDKVQVIGIFGMGGVGKTTLAKHIHNRLGEETQDHVHWITVSQVFSIRKLQDEIAKVFGLDLSNENDEEKRAAKIHRALSKRNNFVLILDDVWKNINLEMLGAPLRVDGCRLIITTRSLEVCGQMGCRETIEVKTLPRDEAWTLFKETLGQKMILTPQVKEIAKLVANECDGLPLGLITMAGSMRGVSEIHVWRNALEELKESLEVDDMEDKVFRVLKYSFDRLDPDYKGQAKRDGYTNLQLCFLYCSLYPEDFKIEKRELIEHLIWEKLLDRRKSRRAEFDQGFSILDKLVNVRLLEGVDRSKSVKMHDLVRDMAIKITRDDLKFKVLSGLSLKDIPNREWTEDLNKMSLMYNSISEIPPGMSPNCPKLSTLLLSDNPLVFIPDSFFLKMSGLSVLNLSYTKIEKLPKSLSDLESLNALILRYCRKLVFVPNLGNLKALRELDLPETAIEEIPQGMENLVNLKYLSLASTRIKKLPTGLLPRFLDLQCLILCERIKVDVEEIKSLKYLEVFNGLLKDVTDFNSLITLRQNHGYPLWYNILLREDPLPHHHWFGTSVLGNQLTISFETRDWLDVIFLAHDIQLLRFKDCEGLSSSSLCDDFLRFNNLKCLKILMIEGSICRTNCILCLFTNDALVTEEELQSRCLLLRSIEVIHLVSLPNLTGLIDWERYPLSPPLRVPDSIFLSLRKLSIAYCSNIKKLWLPLSDLQNLEVITIKSCYKIEEIIDGTNEEETEGSRGSVISLRKLKELELEYLPKLHRIFKATMECSHLESIGIFACPSLKKLSLFLPLSVDGQTLSPPPTLKNIYLGEKGRTWWDSLEWDNPNHKQILEPFLSWENMSVNRAVFSQPIRSRRGIYL